MSNTESKRRSPILAGFLSLILPPGLGQIYVGRLKRGILLLLGYEGLLIFSGLDRWLYTFKGLAFTLCLFTFYALAASIDAIILAVKIRTINLRRYNRWYIYVVIVLLVSVSNWTLPTSLRLTDNMRPYKIRSQSMMPTLKPGDRFMVDFGAYSHNLPRRGDIVVFTTSLHSAGRIVAFGGEEVLIKNNELFVDGQLVDEPYLQKNIDVESDTDFGPFKVPNGEVFILGDNRSNSVDSRLFGSVDIKTNFGKALYIYYSKDHARIGLSLDNKMKFEKELHIYYSKGHARIGLPPEQTARASLSPSCPMYERVDDKAILFTDEQHNELSRSISQIDRDTTIEVGVLTVPTLDGQSIGNTALKAFNSCGIGKDIKNNGILILVAENDRQVRIEVGYGLEPIITDNLTDQILDTKIIPEFKKGNFGVGVIKGVNALKELFYDNAVKHFFAMKWNIPNFESFISDYHDSPLYCDALMFLGRFYEDKWESGFLFHSNANKQKSVAYYQRYLAECPEGIRRKIVEHELSLIQEGKKDRLDYLKE